MQVRKQEVYFRHAESIVDDLALVRTLPAARESEYYYCSSGVVSGAVLLLAAV
jgi:hypothetical protein